MKARKAKSIWDTIGNYIDWNGSLKEGSKQPVVRPKAAMLYMRHYDGLQEHRNMLAGIIESSPAFQILLVEQKMD